MKELILMLLSSVLVNNFVLMHLLGICPLKGASTKIESALAMSMLTTCVMTLSSMVSYLMHHYILLPLNLEFLKTLSFILVISVVVQFTDRVINQTNPLLHRVLGIFLPLITTNCAILAVVLLNCNRMDQSFLGATTYAFGVAVGFSLVLVMFSTIRERITAADVPTPFRGASIELITAGLMSLAFMGFTGLVTI